MSSSEAPRVGVLLSGETVPRWMARALQFVEVETDATITRLVVDDSTSDDGTVDTLQRLVELREWAPFAAAISLRSDPHFAESVPIDEVPALADAERTYCEPVDTDGFGQELPASAVADLEPLDLVVRFGFGILVGEALTAPTHGVLSYHHGDLTEYRGQPAGFWEFVHDEPTAGITVQRITDELDAGEVFAYEEVDITDADTWREVRRRLYVTSEPLLAQATQTVLEGTDPQEPSDLGDLYSLPTGKPVLTYALKTASGYL
ncbi:formyltransferase family protein [Haloarchaeobius amylolyticus]|uniref:formyltransferase family protein n=1 Tax=Haloarchaeobius amylolyticus TaxID=1198296 RepID=UPI00226DFF71|nr:formyltransferase family protein [Haloarchaeobius amylolyticus]